MWVREPVSFRILFFFDNVQPGTSHKSYFNAEAILRFLLLVNFCYRAPLGRVSQAEEEGRGAREQVLVCVLGLLPVLATGTGVTWLLCGTGTMQSTVHNFVLLCTILIFSLTNGIWQTIQEDENQKLRHRC